jgi:surface carbohydrate biosynthesis protein (TIGR04326 family)
MRYNAFQSVLSRTNAEKCVYLCEMTGWEKALICAKKATGSGISLYGYQHGTVSRMLLNYFNDPCEITGPGPYAMPQPDKIICNGRLPYDYMKESGWPEEKIPVVEAIRYNHLKKALEMKPNKKKDVILLAFSISAEESSAILTVACEALKNIGDREIWIKSHPFLDLKKVFKLSGISPEDLPFQFKEGPIEDFLVDARVVVSGESGVTIEALAFGCEVVIVNVPEWINMSPLRHVKTGMVTTAGSAEELKRAVDDVFAKEYRRETYAAEAGRIINDFFCLDEGSNIPSRFLKLLREEKGGIQ